MGQGQSVALQYAAFGKDIVWAADTSCFPNPQVCHIGRQRCDMYAEGSPELQACQKFPNLNGGCYMGKASAIADALEWMHEQRGRIGLDDQENKWHYYNNFPD